MCMVTLIDGTQVDSASEAWRNECEARAVLNLHPKGRRTMYLHGYVDHETKRQVKGVQQIRGDEATNILKATITAIWEQRKAAKLAG